MTMRECRTAQGLLSAHLDDELPAALARRVTEHLAICGTCRAERARLAELRALLRSLPERRAPHELVDELREAAERGRRRQRTRRRVGVAAVAVALASGAVAGLDSEPEPAPSQVSMDELVSEHLSVRAVTGEELGP